jgi:predicted nucleic acid-binding protein
MVLADTSIWISHFRGNTSDLSDLLNLGIVVTHPIVIGELSCGNLNDRQEILGLMKERPEAVTAEYEEVLEFIEAQGLMGRGLGWVDAHLLASALLSSIPLWTEDKKLAEIAVSLDIGVGPS